MYTKNVKKLQIGITKRTVSTHNGSSILSSNVSVIYCAKKHFTKIQFAGWLAVPYTSNGSWNIRRATVRHTEFIPRFLPMISPEKVNNQTQMIYRNAYQFGQRLPHHLNITSWLYLKSKVMVGCRVDSAKLDMSFSEISSQLIQKRHFDHFNSLLSLSLLLASAINYL